MSPPPDIDALSPTELKSLVFKLLEEQAEFRRTIGALRDEIARLKGGPGRPDIKANVKPSGMERASEAQPSDPSGERRRRRGGTRAKLTIDEERTLEADAAARLAFQRLRELPGSGSDDPPARHRLSPGMLADPGRQDGDGSLAGGHRWSFRTGTAPLRARPISSGTSHGVATGRIVARLAVVISKREVVRLLIAGEGAFSTKRALCCAPA